MNWAQRRKLTYAMGVILVIALALSFLVHKTIKVEATCFDGKKNQGEVGADCGGPCAFYCVNELADPKVRWSKTFTIRPGIIHAVAYIEHSYPNAAARSIRYSFKVYDDQNNLITERIGSTFLGPMGRTAIIETLIETGNVNPFRTIFTILPPLPWEKIPSSYSQVVIKTDKKLLENLEDSTRLTTTIENTSRISFRGMEIDAILYDKDDNAIAVSKSALASLPELGSKTVVFTWPFVMPETVARIEIIPRFNPFNSLAL